MSVSVVLKRTSVSSDEEPVADQVPEQVRALRRAARKPRAIDDVRDAVLDRLDQARDVGGVVLEVGVLDERCPRDVGDRRPQRRALPLFAGGPDGCRAPAGQLARIAGVPSVEPSSTTIISFSSVERETRSSTPRWWPPRCRRGRGN